MSALELIAFEVTHLDAINLDFEMFDHAQQGILYGTDIGTLEPQILTPTSELRSVAPTSEPWILRAEL